jgi:HPt (histidine-containing phosphotransfer) domain-containing protein
MTIDDQNFASAQDVTRLMKDTIKKKGLFYSLNGVNDKDTMKWILVKFLKETLEFLSTNEEARKTQRGKIIEEWIDENLNLPGGYS